MNPLYTRHFALDEFDSESQSHLQNAKVLVIGCGGLGHLVSTYLTTAGIGTLVLNDFDSVDETNLQRQFLFTTEDIGKNKARIAKNKLEKLNSEYEIQAITERLTLAKLIQSYSTFDCVVDCSDNFGTRFLINQFSVKTKIPLISGAAIRFEGQITSFIPDKNNPCYQCLFPENHEQADDCEGNGILAPVTGVIASYMSSEVIKLITKIGQPLVGRLQLFNAKDSEWRNITYTKDPACEVCSV